MNYEFKKLQKSKIVILQSLIFLFNLFNLFNSIYSIQFKNSLALIEVKILAIFLARLQRKAGIAIPEMPEQFASNYFILPILY